ncbi:MAG: class I SAM-dependent methyltransferase [Gammaproteobacteria bacterium]|nr:class I SAM-dependent methyltransferase [Gammaproteobacteria bacterium]NNJ72259.1 class I SAM-dependent methyltransferase [Enterobacterales bacterium]
MSLAQWSNYWAAGNLTSLPNDFKHNYDGEIQNFWFRIFARLPEKASILDVCTGNGAVAYLALDYADTNNKNWQITAIDGAEIRQDKVRENHAGVTEANNDIEFISNVLIEDMQLDTSFDLITSQYGIEYCDWLSSAQIIHRHLSHNGHFACLTHAPETDITEHMRAEKDLYRWLERQGVFESMQKLLDGRLGLKQTQKQHKRQYAKLVQKWQQLQAPLLKGFVDYTYFMLSVTPPQLKDVLPQVSNLLGQHEQAYQRLLDIVGVADRIKHSPEWISAFTSNGLQLENTTNVHYQGQHLAGIGYEFSRSHTA